jgi:tetratricopeptide (TPR) repeat protein
VRNQFPVSHLPLVGRDDLLDRLDVEAAGSRPVTLVQAIHGLGGVGKTRLMVEYALRHLGDFDIAWFLRAGDPVTLLEDYVALGVELAIVDADAADLQASARQVTRWLSQEHADWLLLFDDAPNPAALADVLPQSPRGRVLVTSRNPNWDQLAHCIAVPALTVAQSIDLLLTRTRQDDRESARLLAIDLGGLPLALQQASAYVVAAGTTLSGYLDLFRRERSRLWTEERPPDDHRATVGTTFTLAIEELHRPEHAGGRTAVDLITLCAFLAPEPDRIPLDLFNDPDASLPGSLQDVASDPIVLNRAVMTLRSYSLVERDANSLALHRLVQVVARDRLAQQERGEWEAAAMLLVSSVLPEDPDDFRHWPAYVRLEPHVRAVAGGVVLSHPSATVAASMLGRLGVYLRSRAQFSSARDLLERALQIEEAAYGPDHPDVASTLSNLGNILYEQGDLTGARERQERALRIFEEEHGPDHPQVSSTLSNLGIVLRHQGDLAGARERQERALRIDEATFGPDHPEVARTLGNLSNILYMQGDLAGARERLERVLRIFEGAYGADHPDVASTLSNLSNVLYEQGDRAGARDRLERALRIKEAAYGADHPDVARTLGNLGIVLQEQGDLAGARAQQERALRIDEAVYGPNHPEVANTLSNLGNVLYAQGDLVGARDRLERALRIEEAALGPDHPEVASTLGNLGNILYMQGDLAGARERLERVLRIFEGAYGADHPDVARTLGNLGIVLQEQGDLVGARDRLEAALRIKEAILGPDHPEVASILNNLGNILQKQGDLTSARERLERALRIKETVYGLDHPSTVRTRTNLDTVLAEIARDTTAPANLSWWQRLSAWFRGL